MLDGKSSCFSQTDMKKCFAREVQVLGFGSFLTCDCLIFWPSAFRVTLIRFVSEIFYRLTLIERRRLLLEAECSGGKKCDDVEPRSHL